MHEFTFRKNPDELHCVQCAVGMALQALTGEDLSSAELEDLTDFVPGQETWPFAAMLAMADRGLHILDVQSFDPELFVRDPREALMRQTGNDQDVVDRVFEVSDVARQVELVKKCMENSRIHFEERLPSINEFSQALDAGAVLLVNVNTRMLRDAEGYAGHMVMINGYSDGVLNVEDPGPPPQASLEIGIEAFERAWRSPTDGMANYVAVSTKPIETATTRG